jgi:SHAQKYF class myb-like DNA-binding protein
MRKSPAASCSRIYDHDSSGQAPCVVEACAVSVHEGADTGRCGTRPAYEDCQFSAESVHVHPHHIKMSVGDTNKRAQQNQYQPRPFFSDSLPILASSSETSKRTASTRVAESCLAHSCSEKCPHGTQHRKPRMVWSEDLHNQFLRAVTDIGLRHAVPKSIHKVSSSRLLFVVVGFLKGISVQEPTCTLCHVTLHSLDSCMHQC